jgi:alpha-L-fucosidase
MPDLLTTPGETDWFVRDRFGLFIHWGLYAMAARHEWVKSQERIPDDVYDRRYFDRFDPDLYDPDRWAELADRAGMKYFVVTTKHHDGFCLWDSKHTAYKATNTPAGRDLLRPMVLAFGRRGLRTGFYHSLIDWHHPDYIVDSCNHPRRNELKDGDAVNQGRDMARYQQYLHDQVRELLTDYSPEILWFDFSFTWNAGTGQEGKKPGPNGPFARDDFRHNKGREAWDSERLYGLVRELRPDVILNDRLDLDRPLAGGDVKTPEQATPQRHITIEHDGRAVPVVWEACQTFSGSWGYHRDEADWRSMRQLIQTLIDCVSKGGNLLLNVGPTGRGEFDQRAVERLEGVGDWMRQHGRSIYGCGQAPPELDTPRDCRLTWNADTKRLYVHLFAWPYKFLELSPAFRERVEYAQLLHDASELPLKATAWETTHGGFTKDALVLTLPQREPAVEIPVIELFLN